MNKSKQVIELDQKHYMNTFGGRYGLVLAQGQGCRVSDLEGKTYLDLLGGIAVNLLGHAHPAVLAAITEQAGKLIHCSNLYFNEPQARLAARLACLSGLSRCFLTNSGAEANEAALKLARAYFYKQGRPRPGVLSIEHSFHGRTLATITATGQPKYNKAFAPLPEHFSYLPFNDLDALEKALNDDVACLFLELVQGESGIHPVDKDYALAAAELCRRNGSLLIVDEIQSGLGRCGRFTASQLYGLEPDILTLAKGLGGGVPVGACLAGENVAAAFAPGDHGTTFGGNPLAAAAALAVLDELEKSGLITHAAEMGDFFAEQALALAERLGISLEVRGFGLMLALESPVFDALALRAALQEKGVLVNGIAPHTLRLLPPLIITLEEIMEFFELLEACLK